ncbi:5021_t:CDS:1, partial [Acaulospora morrowiae]
DTTVYETDHKTMNTTIQLWNTNIPNIQRFKNQTNNRYRWGDTPAEKWKDFNKEIVELFNKHGQPRGKTNTTSTENGTSLETHF